MPVNAHPEYIAAEAEYYRASTPEQKILALEKMIRFMPKHKSAENLRKNIRNRYKKLKREFSIKKKKSKNKPGIKKEQMQAVLVGFTNSGKSSILNMLTNAHSKIAEYGFTTTKPEAGILNYQGCNIQIIDLPSILSKNFDRVIINNTNTLLIIIDKISDINEIVKELNPNPKIKRVVVFNKVYLYNEDAKRKISENLKSKKHGFVLTSCRTTEGFEELKEKIFESFDIMRVYTKKNEKEKDGVPVILQPNSTLNNVAEKVLHGYSKRVKYAKIWGPSSKFPGQKVGLSHVVKDKDSVEFFTE